MGSATHAGARRHLTPKIKLDKGGPVAERVAQLLADPKLNLQDIADRVVKEVEGASTSARSVASIAAGLRREGFDIPDRRRGNGRAAKASPKQVVAARAKRSAHTPRASR